MGAASMGNLVDSSVWVALFLDFDTQHARAGRLFSRMSAKIYLPYCVISEVVTILAYKHSKKQADRFIAFIENNRDIEWVEDAVVPELEFYTSLDARVSFTDAALLMFAKKLKAKLITFDEQLKRLGKRQSLFTL